MFRYSEAFKQTEEWEDWAGGYPKGSMLVSDLHEWARNIFRFYLKIRLPLKPQLKKSWRTKIRGRMYSELWVRYYSLLRHHQECMVVCSDYANQITEQELPIVRDEKLDCELLLAHAQILHWVNAKKKKGQTNVRRQTTRRVKKRNGRGLSKPWSC